MLATDAERMVTRDEILDALWEVGFVAESNAADRHARNPIRAAVYHRVSFKEQVDGYALDAQARATRASCEGQGWDIVQTDADAGCSARTDDLAKRPAFAQMLVDAEADASI